MYLNCSYVFDKIERIISEYFSSAHTECVCVVRWIFTLALVRSQSSFSSSTSLQQIRMSKCESNWSTLPIRPSGSMGPFAATIINHITAAIAKRIQMTQGGWGGNGDPTDENGKRKTNTNGKIQMRSNQCYRISFVMSSHRHIFNFRE